MWDLVGNPEDKFSPATAHTKFTIYLHPSPRQEHLFFNRFVEIYVGRLNSLKHVHVAIHTLSQRILIELEKQSLCVRKPTICVSTGPTQTGLYSHRSRLEP